MGEDPLPQKTECSKPLLDEQSLEVCLTAKWPAVCASKRLQLHGSVVVHSGKACKQHGIDIAVVIDVSRSMVGEKVQQVMKALESLASQLEEPDRLTVITFSSCAQQVLPFTVMTARGRRRVFDACHAIKIGRGSSVGIGILLAAEVLQSREFANDVSAILVMSDGQSVDKSNAKLILGNPQQGLPTNTRIFTFGYGCDHSSCLEDLASAGNGQFFSVHDMIHFPA